MISWGTLARAGDSDYSTRLSTSVSTGNYRWFGSAAGRAESRPLRDCEAVRAGVGIGDWGSGRILIHMEACDVDQIRHRPVRGGGAPHGCVAGVSSQWPSSGSLAAEDSLLGGKVVSSGGQGLAGIPVRAHRENGTIAVSVYTNGRGDYSFPGWSDVSPGSYAVGIELPDFEPVEQRVTLAGGKTTRLDFTLRSRQPSIADATASEIVAALPGTDDQKHLLIQCDNCHSLQFALRTARTKDEWTQIIRRMAGERAVSRETPGTRAFGQKNTLNRSLTTWRRFADRALPTRFRFSCGPVPRARRPPGSSSPSTTFREPGTAT